jgi:hypothetical protein
VADSLAMFVIRSFIHCHTMNDVATRTHEGFSTNLPCALRVSTTSAVKQEIQHGQQVYGSQ